MEKNLARIITRVIGGSYIAMGFFVVLIWFVLAVGKGDYSSLFSSNGFLWIFWGSLYLFSIYMIYSLVGKSKKRRLLSWSFSIIYHLSLLAYFALELDAGIAAFVIGIPELIIIVLSLIGFAVCVTTPNEVRSV